MGQTLPSTGGSAGPDASQGMAGPSDCQGILLIEIQLDTNQNPQISFCGAALLPLIPQSTIYRQRCAIPDADLGAMPFYPQGSQLYSAFIIHKFT